MLFFFKKGKIWAPTRKTEECTCSKNLKGEKTQRSNSQNCRTCLYFYWVQSTIHWEVVFILLNTMWSFVHCNGDGAGDLLHGFCLKSGNWQCLGKPSKRVCLAPLIWWQHIVLWEIRRTDGRTRQYVTENNLGWPSKPYPSFPTSVPLMFSHSLWCLSFLPHSIKMSSCLLNTFMWFAFVALLSNVFHMFIGLLSEMVSI